MSSLQGKKIIVTGALGALGRDVCTAIEAMNGSVIRLDITSDSQSADSYAVDLSDRQATWQCFKQLGSFNGLVNLAGGFAMGETSWESDDQYWDLMFKLNVMTMRNAVKAAVPTLLRVGGGSIVNIGAYGALQGIALMSAYCASKSAVMRITESLSDELKEQCINVNAVLPTVIDTQANRSAMPERDPNKWVASTDLAQVICFLLSPASRAIHGALIPVRGLS